MKLGGTILTLIMSAYILRPVFPYVEYALNKDYIAKVLCVNKDKAEMKCNGKCHLNKQLKEQSKEEEKPAAPLRIPDETIQLWHHVNNILTNQELLVSAEKHISFYTSNYKYLPFIFIFHPPD